MFGYFCIGILDFMLESKILLDYINLFCPNEYKENDRIKIKYFSISKKVKMKKVYWVICGKYRKFKNLKISYIFEKNINSFYYLQ